MPTPSTSPYTPPHDTFDLYRVQDRKRFHRMLEHGSKLVLVLGENGMLRYATPLARQAFQDFAPVLPGRHFFSMVHRSDLCELTRRFEQMAGAGPGASHSGTPPPLLLRLFTRRDRWRWFEATVLQFSYCMEENVIAIALQPLSAA